MNKKENNKVWISLGNYNCIKETKENKFVVLNDSTFVETLDKTLDKWYFYLEENKILCDDIKKIKEGYNKNYDFTNPSIEIELTDDYEIYHQYNISLKVEDFMKGAIKYLKDNPLHLYSWHYSFKVELLEKLNSLKKKLSIKE